MAALELFILDSSFSALSYTPVGIASDAFGVTHITITTVLQLLYHLAIASLLLLQPTGAIGCRSRDGYSGTTAYCQTTHLLQQIECVGFNQAVCSHIVRLAAALK